MFYYALNVTRILLVKFLFEIDFAYIGIIYKEPSNFNLGGLPLNLVV